MTVSISILMLNSAMALADWLFSGVFLRFPDLKIVLSEGGIGWIPWSIGRCDQVWETHGLWTKSPLTEPPSEYFRRNCYGCFIDDVFGASVIERIGVDNVMVESDYPHTDMSFPDTAEKVEKALAHLTDDVFRQVVRGNAERVFHFEPSGLGLR
jgi:predicted TIM-barrel fold metal-dependent hydrolase